MGEQEILNVGVLPVSGGAFPIQLAGLSKMCQTKHHFDVVLASSGGNVAAYLAMSGSWHWAGIERAVNQMRPDWFSRAWSPVWLLSSWYSYTNRCMRASGKGVLDFMLRNFSRDSVQQTEIWTGAFNKTTQKTCLFCNLDRDKVTLRPSARQLLVANQEDPIYASGDLGLISKYSLASASIPHAVPGVEINGSMIIDGGMSSASPLSTLATEIENHPAKVINLTYFSYGDVETTSPCTRGDLVTDIMGTIGSLIKCLAIADRRRACEIIARRGPLETAHFAIDWNTLEVVEELRKQTGSSMLEIYSTCTEYIDIDEVHPEAVMCLMKRAENNMHGRLWYISKDAEREKGLLQKIRDLELDAYRRLAE